MNAVTPEELDKDFGMLIRCLILTITNQLDDPCKLRQPAEIERFFSIICTLLLNKDCSSRAVNANTGN
jgi:hypothetical protein